MAASEEPRDLLAERIRRLEARVAEMSDGLGATQAQIRQASAHLDTLVDLVGRLSRVVHVQGDSLHGDESALESKVGAIENEVGRVVDGLESVMRRLEHLGNQLDSLAPPKPQRS